MPDGTFVRFAAALTLTLGLAACPEADRPGRGVPGEHPGVRLEGGLTVSAQDVIDAIRAHVEAKAREGGGYLVLEDPVLGRTWRLALVEIHRPVRTFQEGGRQVYFACCDFRSAEGDDVLDVDFWLVRRGDDLGVVETRIHKVNGSARYGYEGHRPVEVR